MQHVSGATRHAARITLSLLYVCFYGSGAAWVPFFNVYLRQLGLTGLQIGIVAGVRPVVMLLSQPFWGVGADAWGRRRTLLLTLALSAILLPGYLWGRSFHFFLGWTVLYMLLANPAGPLIDSLVLDYLERRRELTFGQLRLWGAVGWATIAAVVGSAISGRDMRLIFLFAGVLLGLGWLLALRTAETQGGAASLRRSWTGLGTLLRNRDLLLFLGFVTLLQMGAASIFTFYPVYMHELGASPRLIGAALSVQGVSELPLYLAAATIIARIGPGRTMALAMLTFALRAFLYSFITQPMLAAAVEVTHGLSFSLFLVAAVEYVDRHTPSDWRATGQSLFSAAYFGAGSILGNAWAGFLVDRAGIQGMFRTNAWLILAVAITAGVILHRGASVKQE